MLNQSFNQKPPNAQGNSFRAGGKTVTNPRQILAIAMQQDRGTNQALAPASPLAQALSKKKKKAY